MANHENIMGLIEKNLEPKFEIRGLYIKSAPENDLSTWLKTKIEEKYSDEFGTDDKFKAIGFAYPYVKDKRLFLAMAFLMAFLFEFNGSALDGQVDSEEFLVLAKDVSAPVKKVTKLNAIFKKFMKKFGRYLTGDQFSRFYDKLENYLQSIVENKMENKFNCRANFLLDEFWEIRRKTLGTDLMLFTAEVSSNFDLSQIEQDQPSVEIFHKFNAVCARTLILINDLFSLKKEVKENNYYFNYLYLKLVKEKAKSIQEVVDVVVIELNSEIESLQKMRKAMIETNRCFINYLDAVNDFIVGSLFFSWITMEYNLMKERKFECDLQQLIKFTSTLDLIVETVANMEDPELSSCSDYVMKIYKYNLSIKKDQVGVFVLWSQKLFYQTTNVALSEEQTQDAYVLAWVVRIILNAITIFDDIVDESTTKGGQPCWHKVVN